jgi:hypothetical protein
MTMNQPGLDAHGRPSCSSLGTHNDRAHTEVPKSVAVCSSRTGGLIRALGQAAFRLYGSANRASLVHQLCARPQWGHAALVTVSGSFRKVSSSAKIPVENSLPVIGHFSINAPMLASLGYMLLGN